MPMITEWADEERSIIVTTSEGAWTWNEYHHALEEVIQMAETVDHRVDLINVALMNAKSPPGSGMPHYQRAMKSLPANISMMVMANRSILVKAIFNVFGKLRGSSAGNALKMAAARSMQEAFEIIQKDRQKEPFTKISPDPAT
ncbi:MAG: hypothetical protein KC546_06410 [Anaerolineae bacterium]|nr:hypothetical protein [Anaerolineae bacterium]MCA9887983.1 hypothetical protein [Anaerolineae bacterium]